jgi:hypothetical protein
MGREGNEFVLIVYLLFYGCEGYFINKMIEWCIMYIIIINIIYLIVININLLNICLIVFIYLYLIKLFKYVINYFLVMLKKIKYYYKCYFIIQKIYL